MSLEGTCPKIVKVKRLTETAKLPTYGTPDSAACDLYADLKEPVTIAPHETVLVGTGLSMEPVDRYCGLIFARSGLANKSGLAPANKVGLIDNDYRGEYLVALHNHSEIDATVSPGDRIAQLMFIPYEQVLFSLVDELSSTERGSGGFGSTGK